MSWEFLLTKGFNAALVLAFFGLIVLLLRFLYGPRGIFRDPEWDRWNEEARRELEKSEDAKADERLRRAFLDYGRSFFSGGKEADASLELKVKHTFCVYAHAKELAEREAAFSRHDVGRALRLAALFHDIGRFEQFRRYKTFADAMSCNHGTLGARVLRGEGFLKNETKEMQRVVLTAVAAHNRLHMPEGIRGAARDVLLGLRDADKLDILRIMEENLAPGAQGDSVVLLHLENRDGAWSAAIERALNEKRVALYSDMRFVNDFRLLLCTWLYDLNFMTSLDIVKREGHFERILDGLGNIPAMQAKARAVVEERLALA